MAGRRMVRKHSRKPKSRVARKSIKKVVRMVKAIRPPLLYSDAIKDSTGAAWASALASGYEDVILGYEAGQTPFACISINPTFPVSGTAFQGQTTNYNTVGQAFRLKMLRIRIKAYAGSLIGTLTTPPTNFNKQFRVIVAVCQDQTPLWLSVRPNITDILEGATLAANDDAMITAPYLANARQRWSFLYDRVHSLSAINGYIKEIKILKRLHQNVIYAPDLNDPSSQAVIAPGHGAVFIWILYGADTSVYTPPTGTNYMTFDIKSRNWGTAF